jgi:hypothetical protein
VKALFMMASIVLTAACLQQPACQVEPYLALNGEEVDASVVRIERAGDRLSLQFEAPETGVYRVGLALTADAVQPLAPGLEEYAPGDLEEAVTLRYPYDWTYVGRRNVLNYPRLAIPGVLGGGQAYVMDTHDLTAATVEPTEDGRVRALLLVHRYTNDGADAATADLALEAGERVALNVDVFDGLRAAAEGRAADGRDPGDATMVQVAYRGWTLQKYGEAEYTKVAAALEGVYDWIIVREIGALDWIPPILHEHGLKAIHYQYIGALRRHSDEVTEEMPETIGMKGAAGDLYAAPHSPDGNWLLADIRRPEIREIFVQRAVDAIEAGYDGVFLDGTIFWPDSTGRRGGDVPDAEHSLAWAHWKLLGEMAAAIHAVDPDATLSCLGNDCYDALGQADFVLKERMYFAWDEFAREFNERETKMRANLDVSFETGEAPLYGVPLAYGVKGYSPIAVRSGISFLREPTGLLYLGTGDHTPPTVDEWLTTVVDHARPGLHITTVDPEHIWLHFQGRDQFYAEADCRIEVSQPACLADPDGVCQVHQATEFDLEADRRYRLLESCDEE